MPCFSVLHYFPEFVLIHVHWVSDAIQPLLPPLPVGFNLSQHQSFPMSWLFASGGQTVGASISASVLPINIQGWFPLELTGLISLMSKGLSSLLQHHNSKAQFFGTQPFLWSNSHIRTWLLERPQLWLHGPLLARWLMSLLFSMLSRFVIAFLPRTNCFLISWLQSPIYFNKKVTEYN